MAEVEDVLFEQVGLAAGRTLAVQPASEWKKTTPNKGGERPSGFKAETLADNLNFAAHKMISQANANGHSWKNEGLVTRAIPSHTDKTFLDQVVEMAYETSGAGGSESQLAQVFSRFDRFGKSFAPKNMMFSGYTFFSRPRLCLTDWNICADRKFGALMTTDVKSIPFAIRCLLDTQFASDFSKASDSPLVDINNPFLIPLCNAVKSISGFNDPMLATETSAGGFFSEDQTVVIGGDRMSRTYDINCQFRDYPGSPILAIIDYWCQYMANLTDGSMQQYSDAIDFNRMDYTVSIYRFLMDRTNRYITRWAKCTGCFPVSPPSGVSFNMNEGDRVVETAASISVPFKANRIEYDDPVILKEFNMLVRRYALDAAKINGSPKGFAHNQAQNNFAGVPYITPTGNGYELVWLQRDIAGESIINGDGNSIIVPKTNSAGNSVL